MSNATALSNVLAVFAATYLLHSTLLMGACWILLRVLPVRSYFVVEQMWKLAAVLGLLTAGAQVLMEACWRPETAPMPSEDVAQAVTAEGSGLRLRHPAHNAEYSGHLAGDGPSIPANFSLAESPTLSREDATLLVKPASPTQPRDQGHQLIPQDDRVESPAETKPTLPAGIIADTPHLVEQAGNISMDPHQDQPQVPVASIGPTWRDALRAASPWMMFLVSVGLAGSVVAGAVLLAFQSLRLHDRFATARLLQEGRARHVLDRFLKRHKIRRRVNLLSCPRHTEPVTYGLFAWTIVLPECTEERLGNDELKALLAHEVAHLVRGDVWWLWIGRVLCTCLAFQPLNWLARRRWQQAAEYLCDDWAVFRGVRSMALARCLTQIAEWRFGREAHQEVGLAAGGTKATLVQRVERLVEDDRRADVWSRPLCRRLLTMGVAVAVVGLAGFAPRVALPLAFVSERDGVETASGSPVDEDTARDWHALEEELLQLDAELVRATELLGAAEPRQSRSLVSLPASTAVNSMQENFNRRAAVLRARRGHIASLLGKDSER